MWYAKEVTEQDELAVGAFFVKELQAKLDLTYLDKFSITFTYDTFATVTTDCGKQYLLLDGKDVVTSWGLLQQVAGLLGIEEAGQTTAVKIMFERDAIVNVIVEKAIKHPRKVFDKIVSYTLQELQ